ncbi:MAG: PLP-dependent transferase [Gemmatimonadaceae bacterium]|jgi:methionine-gamma-lyase|nr:PLP-dependent transferase [Gemmatimonadaceae bacterium]
MTPRDVRRAGPSTLAIHGGAERGDVDAASGAIHREVPPEVEYGTAEFVRRPSAPNADAVARRLAGLEGGEAAQVMASGMGATAAALLALLRPGDHLLASSWLPGGTRRFLVEELGGRGVDVALVDPLESRGWRKRLRKQTRAIFVESPSSGSGRVLDLRPISYLTHESGLALVVDATRGSPAVVRPLDHGADLVLHASLRHLAGHADLPGGVVVGTAPVIDEVREKMYRWGQVPDPEVAWLLQRGLATLELRLARQAETAGRIAAWAADRRDVRRVHWPGLPEHPDHEIALAMLVRPLPTVGLELGGGTRAAERLLKRLRLIRPAPALGGVETTASEPRHVTHQHLDAQERGIIGIPDGLVQIACGLEDAADLIADLEQALR